MLRSQDSSIVVVQQDRQRSPYIKLLAIDDRCQLRRAVRHLGIWRTRHAGLAYAATIHKSQGSEYPAVVIPVITQHYAMLQRNLLYTGVTRGKRLVVLVGQKKAVAIAVRNVSGRRRWSKLGEWLRPGPPLSRQIGMAG
jgi:hypothetical protein